MSRSVVVIMLLITLTLINAQGDDGHHRNRRTFNKEHIKEDLHRMMPEGELDVELENQEAMDFHYFKIHDYDGNNKLDGLELGAAMTHYHEGGEHDATPSRRRKVDIDDQELANLIRQILKDDDLNDDGYVDYYEFIQSQNRRNENM